MHHNGFIHKISFQLCSLLLADPAVAASADGAFHSLAFPNSLFIMKHPIHEGLECVTAFRAQGLDFFVLGIFLPDPFGFEFIDTELILFTNIAKGLCQVKKILPQTGGNTVTTDRKK